METRTLPSIISSREISGVSATTSSQNLAWNDDGQCLIVSRQAVTIATPYLTTDLPPPTIPLSYKVLGDKEGKEDDEEEEDMDVDGGEGSASAPWRSLARPGSGEVKWWIMGVVGKGKGREEDYGWTEVGDEVTQVVTERERYIRGAVWSPSGLSRLGGCLLAVMSNTFQVSVYAPGDDTLNSEYEEIADLTLATKRLLEPGLVQQDGTPTVKGMLRMRAVAMAWSGQPGLAGMIGVDGSVLALATRAGGVDFWSYGGGELSRVAQVELPSLWGSQLAWSEWTNVDDTTCSAQLAVALTDGSVWVVPVTRRVSGSAESRSWDIDVGELLCAGTADRRAITAIKWVTNEVLVWAKSGSIHVWTERGDTVSTVRLERVGNWAGCNGLGACIGMHLSTPTSLTVVLDSLTFHVIDDILTTPNLRPIESLRATLSARDVFLDCARRRRRKFQAATDRELTASTTGVEALDFTGDILTWLTEPLARHNLDNATHVNRLVDFVTADLKMTDDDSAIPVLSALLDQPQSLLRRSPLRQLAPHIFRLIARGEAEFAEVVYGLLAKVPPVSVSDAAVPSTPSSKHNLMSALWGNTRLDAIRLRWVLARWGQGAFSSMQSEFAAVARTYEGAIHRAVASLVLLWANQAPHKASSDGGAVDREFLSNLAIVADTAQAGAGTGASAVSQENTTSCPACGASIQYTSGQAACTNGHEWDRCSVTQLLITTPDYRVCTVCPAISLLPRSMDGSGGGGEGGDVLVQTALEAAVACTYCGGRWSRPL